MLLFAACGGEQSPELPSGPDPFEPLQGTWSGTASISVQDTDLRCTLGGCSGTLLSRIECPAGSVLTSSKGVLMGTISIDDSGCSLVSGDELYVALDFDTAFEGVATDVSGEGELYEVDFDISLAAGEGSSAFQQLLGCAPRELWEFTGMARQQPGIVWRATLVKKDVLGSPGVVNDIFARCGGDDVVLAMSLVFNTKLMMVAGRERG